MKVKKKRERWRKAGRKGGREGQIFRAGAEDTVRITHWPKDKIQSLLTLTVQLQEWLPWLFLQDVFPQIMK